MKNFFKDLGRFILTIWAVMVLVVAALSISNIELSLDFLISLLIAISGSLLVAFIVSLIFLLSLRMSLLWEKQTLKTNNYKHFMLLIFIAPVICFFIPDIFLGGIYEIVKSYHYIAEFFILMVVNMVTLFVYFRISKRDGLFSKKNLIFTSVIILILFSFSLLTEYMYSGGEKIYWQGNRGFDDKIKTLEIAPSEVDALLKGKGLLIDTSVPMFIVQDTYFRPRLRKLRSQSMTGYYVNGKTGKIEHRKTNYYFKDGIFGLENKRIPPIDFSAIEVLN